ncbi:RNA polymerase sigma factor [Clostridium faecium]|uniref:Sigma-70 family RNA polymerase sigma factor n=1 Tax=Clostridium faecium TaxID=2762223 RepID=A0ABR8YNM0_9CLOT|nr:sigma-70 family RNA polymerase sigma factor [Clostridium faecium]MBD8045814.1 sigma-70 family RNA polymerase sigma factor [Clostridium faecium]
MNDSLYELLRKCKTRDSKYILEIINKFNPLIKKYSYLLNYDDAEQDLIVALIEITYKLPLNKIPTKCPDKYIVSYIHSALKNKYIYLSKKRSILLKQSDELDLNIYEGSITSQDLYNYVFVKDLLSQVTELQRTILILKFIKNYSETEISNILDISRQSVNKAKNRALVTLKKYLSA